MKKILICLSVLILGFFSSGCSMKNEVSFKYYNKKGNSSLLKEKFKDAEKWYLKALESPSSLSLVAENNLARVKYLKGDYEQAKAVWNKLIVENCEGGKIDPYCDQFFYNLGNVLFRIGEKTSGYEDRHKLWEDSIVQYEKELDLKPDDFDAMENIDYIKTRLEEPPEDGEGEGEGEKEGDSEGEGEGEGKSDSSKDNQEKSEEQNEEQKKDQKNEEGERGEKEDGEKDKKDSGQGEEEKNDGEEEQNKDEQGDKQDGEQDKQDSGDDEKDGEPQEGDSEKDDSDQGDQKDGEQDKSDENTGEDGEEDSQQEPQEEKRESRLSPELQKQIEDYQDQIENQEKDLQDFFSRNPKANQNKQNPFNDPMLEQLMQDPMFQGFFGNQLDPNFDKNEEQKPVEKDW